MTDEHPGPDFVPPDTKDPLALGLAQIDATVSLRDSILARIETDRVAQKRRDRVMVAILVVLGLVLFSVVGLFVLRAQGGRTLNEVQATTEYLQECTTPGTKTPTPDDPSTGHACYDRGSSRTGEAINQLNLVSACLALKENGEEPAACGPVVAALDQLRANQNPFAPAVVEP